MSVACAECNQSHELATGSYFGAVPSEIVLPSCHVSLVEHRQAKALPAHAHDWPFICTLIGGSYVSRTSQSEMEFKQNEAVFHPRTFEHRDEIGQNGGRFFCIQLDPNSLEHFREESGTRAIKVVRDARAYVALAELFTGLCRDDSPLAIESAAAEVAGALFAPEPATHIAPRWLARVVEQIEQGGARLEALAQDAGVHPTTLTRLFRRHKGCSIGAYAAAARVRRAFFGVVGSRDRLTDISFDAGFADQSHMTREFRRHLGVTPRALRGLSATAS